MRSFFSHFKQRVRFNTSGGFTRTNGKKKGHSGSGNILNEQILKTFCPSHSISARILHPTAFLGAFRCFQEHKNRMKNKKLIILSNNNIRTTSDTDRETFNNQARTAILSRESQYYHSTFLMSLTLLTAMGLGMGNGKKVRCESVGRTVDAGAADSWGEGERREIDISGITGVKNDAILVHKLKGDYYCTSAKCSHFGVPLKFGFDNTTSMVATCPAHDAAFDIRTGDSIRGPVLKSIDTYPVTIDSKTNKVLVKIIPQEKQKKPCRRNTNNKETICIIGSGAAGYSCAETLRLEGFDGEIVMISKEIGPPIDRTRFSKSLGKAGEMRSLDYIRGDLGINLIMGQEVVEINNTTKTVTYRPNGADKRSQMAPTIEACSQKFDKVLLATGGIPRQVFVPGAKLKNVFTLRTQSDNDAIAKMAVKGHRAVVIGGGFIGLEMASTLASAGLKVTIIEMTDLPLMRVFGKKIGATIAKWLHQNNVLFMGGSKVTYLRGEKQVCGVETDTGDVLPADIVVVATGIQMDSPNVLPLSAGSRGRDGSLLCDPFLKVRGENEGNIYAAGDMCTFPDFRTARDLRIEHWNTAMEQGKIVAKNMLNQYTPYTTIPYFWSEIFGKKLKFVGSIDTHQHAIIEGDCDEMKFIVWYLNAKDEITGVLTMENPKVACAATELMRLGKMPKASEIVVGSCNSTDLIKRLEALQRGEVLKGSVLERVYIQKNREQHAASGGGK